jgi:predicted protein tyrosine phosphatase
LHIQNVRTCQCAFFGVEMTSSSGRREQQHMMGYDLWCRMIVQVFGQRELIDHIHSGGEVASHLVSIGNPGRGVRAEAEDATMPELFQTTFQDYLRLQFYDVEYRRHLGPMRPKRIPLLRDVRRAIRFFNRTKDEATGYTIHCWRGLSRSTAIALGYLYLIHGDDQVAVDELKRIRPEAGPHPRLVSYFDRILGSDLSGKNDQLREIRFREMKEWFMNEIEDGDALLEELEPLD